MTKKISIEKQIARKIVQALGLKKSAKNNPDWARVDEPDFILPSLMYYVIGIPLISALAVFAYTTLNGSLADTIARLLMPLAGSFEERLALLAAGIVIMIGLMVTLFASITHKPDGDDIVEMLSDLDENAQSHITAVEESINQRIDALIADGPVLMTSHEDIAEEIGETK